MIYNPRSHRNLGAETDLTDCSRLQIAKPGARSQLAGALSEFAEEGIELLVIDGGDGTVRDVLTSGHSIFGSRWPVIAVLPKGKTNALAIDLGVPKDWALKDAIHAFENGHRVSRHPMTITAIEDMPAGTSPAQINGFILGAGAFTKAVRAGQSAHRLGAFNSLAVATTALWALTQSVFGSRANAWRRGAKMDLALGPAGARMAHSGHGDAQMRQILFASTLKRLPANIQPFGALVDGLRVLVVDQVSRGTTMMLPLKALGWVNMHLRDRGIHQLATPEFTLTIDDQFIVDGEAFPAGSYHIAEGPEVQFAIPSLSQSGMFDERQSSVPRIRHAGPFGQGASFRISGFRHLHNRLSSRMKQAE